MGVPEGWYDYNRLGKQIEGTRFIAFKVPLKETLNKANQVPEEHQLYPTLLVSLIPNLGLIIDLTNTLKYYNPDEFRKLGVQHEKIKVEGHVVPKAAVFKRFRQVASEFLAQNPDNDKLIGVHCTHGLNRSGFLVCRFMIEEMNFSPADAIAAFEAARGHQIHREAYVEKLKNLDAPDTTDSGPPPWAVKKKKPFNPDGDRQRNPANSRHQNGDTYQRDFGDNSRRHDNRPRRFENGPRNNWNANRFGGYQPRPWGNGSQYDRPNYHNMHQYMRPDQWRPNQHPPRQYQSHRHYPRPQQMHGGRGRIVPNLSVRPPPIPSGSNNLSEDLLKIAESNHNDQYSPHPWLARQA